jgi:hypothetical protein
MSVSTKPSGVRREKAVGLAASCWNASTLAARSFSSEFTVLLFPTPPLPSSKTVSSRRSSSCSVPARSDTVSRVTSGISPSPRHGRSPSGDGAAAWGPPGPPRPTRLFSPGMLPRLAMGI